MRDPMIWKIVADELRAMATHGALTSDSRTVMPGDVFFAYSNEYIADAIERGAAGIVYDANEYSWKDAWTVPHWNVPDVKKWAGHIAAHYYDHPDRDLFVVAVTGTNGKTSCTQWLGSALSQIDIPTAVVGTLGVGVFRQGLCETFEHTGYTTPDAVQLQRQLLAMRTAGSGALAIEASSIGLQEGRLDGMHIDVALFTNLTRDHLDYHGSMVAYEAAKSILFDWPDLRYAIINLDDPMGARLVQRLKHASGVSIIGYTLEHKHIDGIPILSANAIRSGLTGTDFQITSPFGSAHVKTHLIGQFNVSNILGVMGVLVAKGVAWSRIIKLIEPLSAAPGRMQPIHGVDGLMLVIDYAHTPDALEHVLLTLRHIAQERGGQLWCVFGCGGNRDSGKRPQMGAISEAADHVILTSDNPRFEAPQAIMNDILVGMKRTPHWIEDRASAILFTVKQAAKQDVILLAGKGHEVTQEVMGKQFIFSDADHAALALSARAITKGANG